jgi:hypothetical protein
MKALKIVENILETNFYKNIDSISDINKNKSLMSC